MGGPEFLGATGRLVAFVPAGPERDELLVLVRLGQAFRRQQQAGRRPGFLHRYVAAIVERLGPRVTFDELVAELQVEAGRRLAGDERVPLEEASRSWEVIKFHDPRRGRIEVTFGRLRNLLTEIRREKFPVSPIP